MADACARRNAFGRQLQVSRIELEDWTATRAVEAPGVSRTTARDWLARYRADAPSGPEGGRCRLHRSPQVIPPEAAAATVRAWVERHWGSHRLASLTGHPRSTIYAVLVRAGYSLLSDAARLH